MPTKQVMSLFSARAAVTLIISEELKSLISSRSIVEYVVLQPGLELIAVTADGIPILVEGVVTLVVTQRIGRRRAPFRYGDGGDRPGRQYTGVYRCAQVIDDFLNRDNAALGGQHCFLLDADDAFHQHVALAVGALRMDYRYIRADRRYGRQSLTGKGAFDELDLVVDLGQVAADITAQYRQGQTRGTRFIGIGHGCVAMLDQLEATRPAFLYGVPHAMQGADTGVAAPGEDELLGTTGADHLVVDQVRGHADQCQITFALANDFMTRGEGNQVGEAFHRDGITVVDVLGHRVLERKEFSHHMSPLRLLRKFA